MNLNLAVSKFKRELVSEEVLQVEKDGKKLLLIASAGYRNSSTWCSGSRVIFTSDKALSKCHFPFQKKHSTLEFSLFYSFSVVVFDWRG